MAGEEVSTPVFFSRFRVQGLGFPSGAPSIVSGFPQRLRLPGLAVVVQGFDSPS